MSIEKINKRKGARITRLVRQYATGAAIAFVMVALKQSWVSERFVMIFLGWMLVQIIPGVFYMACSIVACFFPGNLYKYFNQMAEGALEEVFPLNVIK